MFNSALIFLSIISATAVFFYIFIIYLMPILKRKQFSKAEFPESWERVLEENFPDYSILEDKTKEEVRLIIKIFMAEKYFEPDEDLKWNEQILICSNIASKIYQEKHQFLSKLSTITIGKELNLGQGLLEVPSFDSLKELDYKKWY